MVSGGGWYKSFAERPDGLSICFLGLVLEWNLPLYYFFAISLMHTYGVVGGAGCFW